MGVGRVWQGTMGLVLVCCLDAATHDERVLIWNKANMHGSLKVMDFRDSMQADTVGSFGIGQAVIVNYQVPCTGLEALHPWLP